MEKSSGDMFSGLVAKNSTEARRVQKGVKKDSGLENVEKESSGVEEQETLDSIGNRMELPNEESSKTRGGTGGNSPFEDRVELGCAPSENCECPA